MKQTLLILLVTLLFIFPQSVLAAGFQLKTIGALNVEGVTYDQLWYSNPNVTFTGTALEGAQITATINGTNETITANTSGNWSYTATLNKGDNSVSFTSNESIISFTLTVGEVPEGVGSLPTTATPAAGVITPTVALLLIGGIFVLLPLFSLVKKANLKV